MATTFYSLPIEAIIDETSEAYTVSFQNQEPEIFHYIPGQYITLRFYIDEQAYRRAYSLSSSPLLDTQLRITIKRVHEGKISNYIRDNLKPGDLVEAMPPMGNFSLSPDKENKKHYILLGAGSGITPLMSMLKTLLEVEQESKVTLWYANRNEQSIIFKDELKQLQQKYKDQLSIYHSLTQPSDEWKGAIGRLDAEHIYQLILELFMLDQYRKQYYLCGPEGFMKSALEAFEKHAINPSDVYKEYYSTPLTTQENEATEANSEEHSPSGEAPIPELTAQTVKISIDDQSHELAVIPQKTILETMIEAKLDPPYACLGGTCTSCKALLHQGEVFMRVSVGLSKEERNEGYILTCQAHPLTDDVELAF